MDRLARLLNPSVHDGTGCRSQCRHQLGGGFASVDKASVFVSIGATRLVNGTSTPANSPPPASQITSPYHTVIIIVGGTSPENALHPATAFTVTWSTSTDPEG